MAQSDGTVSYTYNPSTDDNNNDCTIQGFFPFAETKKKTFGNGCPYAYVTRFVQYYGSTDYADKYIMATFSGTNAGLASDNPVFFCWSCRNGCCCSLPRSEQGNSAHGHLNVCRL